MSVTPEERFERIERILEFIATDQASLHAQSAEDRKIMREHSQAVHQQWKQIQANSQQIAEHSHYIAEQSRQIAAVGHQLSELARLGRAVEVQGQHIDRLAERLDRHIDPGPHDSPR